MLKSCYRLPARSTDSWVLVCHTNTNKTNYWQIFAHSLESIFRV